MNWRTITDPNEDLSVNLGVILKFGKRFVRVIWTWNEKDVNLFLKPED